jgi:hypothetical protein
MTSEPCSGHMIEFYSSNNLAFAYPAVMVNHRNKNFINSVHSYNRVLNDVFENDEINALQVNEASIDVRVDEKYDTFCLFTAGQVACKSQITFELIQGGELYRKVVPVDVKRFGSQRFYISEIFKDSVKDFTHATLKISQPEQFMFFGRMLAGQCHRDGSFAANHSFYDCSENGEYWDDTQPLWR